MSLLKSDGGALAAAVFRLRPAAALLALAAAFAVHSAEAAGWAGTATQALPVGNIPGAVALAPTAPLRIAVALAPRNKAALDAFVAAANTPGNAAYGRFLTPQQYADAYAPTPAQAQAVVAYLSAQGFAGIEVSANRQVVTAAGTAAAAQRAFNTQLVQFTHGGALVYANSTPAQVPAALGGTVSAVLGLQNFAPMQTQLKLAGSAPAGIGVPAIPFTYPFFSGPMFQAAYDAGATPTGSATAIGIVTEGDLTQVPLDLRQYEQEFGLPQVPYQIVATGPQTGDTAGLDEWDLDSQSASGIAGNLKQIVFYNAGSLADADLVPAYNRVVSDNLVKAVNMSFGGCESLEFLTGGMAAADAAFEAGAAEGISFFAASGDGGASCQLVANDGEPVLLGSVEYPASSPWVVSVGGTSLLIKTDGSYDFEAAWQSGGGGISLWEVGQPWQTQAPAASTFGMRGVPDMAMDADANLSPADVVVNGADTGIGGTSLSSPLAVGSWARMQSAHNNCMGFAAPILYGSFGRALGTASLDFNDVILGENYLYAATPGWDYTTGLGSFDIAKVNLGLPACP